jgi:hypothetical protein
VRALAAQGVKRVAPQGAGGSLLLQLDAEEDLGEEYEEGKRLRQVCVSSSAESHWRGAIMPESREDKLCRLSPG